MSRLRHLLPLLLSVTLICGTGVLAVALTTQATDTAENVHLQDRQSLQSTLSSLGKQYLLFSMKEGLDYASTGTWALQAGDPGDIARLHEFVDHAVLLNYGAAVVDLGAHVLTSYAAGPGLPPPDDPGYTPMIRALLAQRPDVSSVMKVDGIAVVAMGVPITVDHATRAVFVGFVRLGTSPLETYVRGLHYGRTGVSEVVDSQGVVVAATDPAAVGHPVGYAAAQAGIASGRTGNYLDARTGNVVSYAPISVGGWGGLTLQRADEFYGPLRAGHVRGELAIVAMLIVASVVVLILGHKRESARRRFHAELAFQAAHDCLTGLVNRVVFHDRVVQALARAKRAGGDLALLFLDLDAFKSVNDQMGHDAGDAILEQVASRLLQAVRAGDTVARMGGDEFAVLLEDVDSPSSVDVVAQRIVSELGRPFTTAGRSFDIGTSIGIAYSRAGDSSTETLLHDADLAMYRAKEEGGRRHLWSPSAGRLTSEGALRT